MRRAEPQFPPSVGAASQQCLRVFCFCGTFGCGPFPPDTFSVQVLDAEWYHCWRCAPDDPRGERPAGELFHSAEELATSVCTRVSTTRQPLLAASTLGYTRAAPETWSALTDRSACESGERESEGSWDKKSLER